VEENAQALAHYAALCQEMGLVPIVEPEVLMDGSHSMQRCRDVTENVLGAVFTALQDQGIALDAMLLKPNMVLPGLSCATQNSLEEVANATERCLLATVPENVAGITFLSGGQSGELASARLNAMNTSTSSRPPWPLAFSFGRALQQPGLAIWRGEKANVVRAQRALIHRARCNRAARRGEYSPAMETP
jgi:fructose-bisphosphate aldolase class I